MSPDSAVIRAVLFDLDNTLLNRGDGFELFCRELYHTSGAMSQTHSEDEAVKLMLSMDQDGQRSRPDLFSDMMRLWPGVFSGLDEAIQVFLTSFPRMLVLAPETRALLEDLQDRPIPCAIVTNGGTVMQTNKIQESGLAGLVDSYLISEQAGVAKPDRRIFDMALDVVGRAASETLFVGDNPDADIVGAKAAGMRAAWIHCGQSWPYDDVRPDYVLGDVAEVRDIVLR